MAKTLKDYKDWIDTYENPTESEQELIDGFKDILDEIFQTHEQHITLKNQDINELRKIIYKKNKELDEKDKQYGILLADRDKLEMYRHNRLKKSDFYEVNHSCDLPDGGRVWIHGHMLDESWRDGNTIVEDEPHKYNSLED